MGNQVKAILAVLALAPAAALAQPMQVTHEGRGMGTLDGVPFGPADFVISATVDPANRQVIGSGFGYFIQHSRAEIDIDGVGVLEFITETRTFVNNRNEIVGFSRAGAAGGADLYNGPRDAQFATWDMLTPIGPVSGTAQLIQWTNTPEIVTSGGVLIFDNDSNVAGTFTAGSRPAPCYPDCDGNEVLDFFDFLCFQNAFLAGDPYADCDGNGVLDFFDFLCFQNEFLAGCP